MSSINYSMIVAASENNVIGKNGTMPWHLKSDLQRFKKLTDGHCIIMGRKCYESIGKPLPNRTNIVVSSNMELEIPGCIVKPSLQYAADYANSRNDLTPFIIGGGTLYRQAINLVNYLYLTRVHTIIKDGDVFFPEINMNQWEIISSEDFKADADNDFDTTFMVLKRKR